MVVGIQDDMRLTALGGFTWGFDVDRAAQHTLLPVEMIGAETIGLGRFININDSLRNDFPAWGLPSQKSYSANTQYYLDLSIVPEPATLCQFVFGIVLVISRVRPTSRHLCSTSKQQFIGRRRRQRGFRWPDPVARHLGCASL